MGEIYFFVNSKKSIHLHVDIMGCFGKPIFFCIDSCRQMCIFSKQPTFTCVRRGKQNIIFCHLNYAPIALWFIPLERAIRELSKKYIHHILCFSGTKVITDFRQFLSYFFSLFFPTLSPLKYDNSRTGHPNGEKLGASWFLGPGYMLAKFKQNQNF